MNKEITFDTVLLETNLKVNDKVININNDDKYSVAYIDLNEAKAVLSHSSLNEWTVIDLRECTEYDII